MVGRVLPGIHDAITLMLCADAGRALVRARSGAASHSVARWFLVHGNARQSQAVGTRAKAPTHGNAQSPPGCCLEVFRGDGHRG